MDAGISEGGKVLVSGKLFADISRSLPNQPVTGSVNGSRLELKCGRSVFALPTLPPDDYPQLPPLPKTSGSVKAERVKEFLSASISKPASIGCAGLVGRVLAAQATASASTSRST